MNIVRRLAIWVLLTVFFASLLLVAYGWMFNETFGNRETVKSWFERSGAYTNFVDELVAVSQRQAAEEGNAVDAKTLAEAANNSFTPELLQTSLERVLDGAYDWLEGKTPDIEFRVDFSQAKVAFADNLTVFAIERVETLPVCDTADETLSFDPFTAPCKPRALNINAITEDFRDLILEDENFIDNPVLDARDINIGDEDNPQTLGEAAAALPVSYQIARYGAVIAITISLLSASGIMWIARDKRKGLFKLFRGFAFTALSLALFTFITSRSTTWLDAVLAVDEAAEGFTERIVKPLAGTITDDLSLWTFRFMVAYAVIAVVLLAIYVYLYKSKPKSHDATKPHPEEGFNKLEDSYKKLVAKKPKEYKKTNPKRKETLKKKHTKRRKAK